MRTVTVSLLRQRMIEGMNDASSARVRRGARFPAGAVRAFLQRSRTRRRRRNTAGFNCIFPRRREHLELQLDHDGCGAVSRDVAAHGSWAEIYDLGQRERFAATSWLVPGAGGGREQPQGARRLAR